MDKSSSDSTTINGGGGVNRDNQFLKHLNKVSHHKISKPARRPAFDPPPPQPQPPLQAPPQQNQPPVYNINKSDFRDVVQKLTGSPAHERLSGTPPCPIQPPKQPNSRLQRIRPPPLVQINNLVFPPPVYPTNLRPPPVPFSPLPPLPPVYTSVPEFPFSNYMHFLHGQVSGLDYDLAQNEAIAPPPPPHNMVSGPITSSAPVSFRPSSPLPFGCLSPRSAA
ncbi:VQ motif-containing protein 9-like [Impatiens glandulifera]|uniref:VQ motif-containing protein 9-like n=1 Tax=Impatiens glandulifera TaxID=253017 RepID=UPI001FB18E6C|nr:VQ motif-containing protein 9-like [Impatiens glandulifera]